MTILSLNVMDLGKAERIRALSKLISDTNPSILLLQETMCHASITIEIIVNLFLGWELSEVNASVLSGGLLSCWNPYFVQFDPFKTDWGNFLEGKFGFIGLDVNSQFLCSL